MKRSKFDWEIREGAVRIMQETKKLIAAGKRVSGKVHGSPRVHGDLVDTLSPVDTVQLPTLPTRVSVCTVADSMRRQVWGCGPSSGPRFDRAGQHRSQCPKKNRKVIPNTQH